MLKIGITGGIGSGKTTVCRIFETLGIPVFYADVVAKEIMIKDQTLISGIIEAFGPESYLEAGMLNKPHIASIVFNDETQLARLNALVHPAVFRAFDEWLLKVPPHSPYILKEAALLFESGSYKMCDKAILVRADRETKLRRVMQRDAVTAEQVQARMDKQFSDAEKAALADYFIENEEHVSLIGQVMTLHQQFLTLRS